jgi:hypothetical protein
MKMFAVVMTNNKKDSNIKNATQNDIDKLLG